MQFILFPIRRIKGEIIVDEDAKPVPASLPVDWSLILAISIV